MTRLLTTALILAGILGVGGTSAAQTGETVPLTSVTFGGNTPISRWIEAGAHLGPIIESYGPVIDVEGQDYVQPSDTYKVVFDAFLGSASPDAVNGALNSAARFLNMHAAAGVPQENMRVAVVLHGPAIAAAVSQEAYREYFGVENPNLELLEALADAGVSTYVCAQAATVAGVMDAIEEPAQVVLSAMTAFVKLEAEGYTRMSW